MYLCAYIHIYICTSTSKYVCLLLPLYVRARIFINYCRRIKRHAAHVRPPLTASTYTYILFVSGRKVRRCLSAHWLSRVCVISLQTTSKRTLIRTYAPTNKNVYCTFIHIFCVSLLALRQLLVLIAFICHLNCWLFPFHDDFFCYFLQAASLRFPLRGPRHLLFCATHASFHFPIQASNVRASHTHIDIHIHTCDGAFSFALLCVHIRSLFSGSYSATDAVTATNVRIVVDTDSVMAHDICSVSTKCANISTNATSIYYTNIYTCVCAILLFICVRLWVRAIEKQSIVDFYSYDANFCARDVLCIGRCCL